MKKIKEFIRILMNTYIPIAPPKPLTKEEKEKREQEIINDINRRIAMRDNC